MRIVYFLTYLPLLDRDRGFVVYTNFLTRSFPTLIDAELTTEMALAQIMDDSDKFYNQEGRRSAFDYYSSIDCELKRILLQHTTKLRCL